MNDLDIAGMKSKKKKLQELKMKMSIFAGMKRILKPK